jgi:hypothetical protein
MGVDIKYEPNERELEYIREVRNTRFDKVEGMSQGGEFAIIASFPESVNLEMISKHGAHWEKNDALLADFLRKNPYYRIGNGGLMRGMGAIEAGTSDEAKESQDAKPDV